MRGPTEMELMVWNAWHSTPSTIGDLYAPARAAIRAMREPTIGMVAAFDVAKYDIGCLSGPPSEEGYWLWESDAAKTAWSAMIDAASPEET